MTANSVFVDEHGSQVAIDVPNYASADNIHLLFLLPLQSPHITQPPEVYAFVISKHKLTDILANFPKKVGMRMPLKRGIACIVRYTTRGKRCSRLQKSRPCSLTPTFSQSTRRGLWTG